MIVFTKCTCESIDGSYTARQIKHYKKMANTKHQCVFKLLTKSNNDKEYHCCECNQRLRILDGKKYYTNLYKIIRKKINLRRSYGSRKL